MKDFGAWFNEQSATNADSPDLVKHQPTDAQNAACQAQTGDPYLDAGVLGAGVLGAGQLIKGRCLSDNAQNGCVVFCDGMDNGIPFQSVQQELPLHMVLHGDRLGAEEFNQDCNYSDVERWLERGVAQRWQVYPVDAVTAYADFSRDGGFKQQRAYMYNFGLRADVHDTKQPSPYTALQLAQVLWAHLQNAWTPGTLVVWRARLRITFDNGRTQGWDALTRTFVGGSQPQLKITLRLGALTPPAPACRVAFKEGDFIPHVKDL